MPLVLELIAVGSRINCGNTQHQNSLSMYLSIYLCLVRLRGDDLVQPDEAQAQHKLHPQEPKQIYLYHSF